MKPLAPRSELQRFDHHDLAIRERDVGAPLRGVEGLSFEALDAGQVRRDGAVELADADTQTGWYVEPSVRLNFGGKDWGFYTRYEDVRGARTRDRFEQWEVGVNFWPNDKVVLKFDYRDRNHDLASDSGRNFQAIDLGVGYNF